MAPRPRSWRDVSLTNPYQAARVNRPGLAAWRSVVPERGSSTRSRGGSGGRRGQPNELERAVAEDALDKGEGFNPFNAGARTLNRVFDALDTPGAFVRSGIIELADVVEGNGDASWRDFTEQGWRNVSGSEMLRLGDYDLGPAGAPLKAALGFTADVVTDPLTYLGGAAARPGVEAGDQAARRFLTPSVRRTLGEAAVQAEEAAGRTFADDAARELAIREAGDSAAAEAAQKAVKFKDNRVLSPIEREAIGAEKGTFVKVPGSRSKRVQEAVERIAGDRAVRMENGRLVVRASERELPSIAPRIRRRLTQNRFADAVASKMTRYPEARLKMLYGTADEAATAIHTLTKANAADLQEHMILRTWGDQWKDVASRLKKAGVSGEDARYALGEDEFGPSSAIVRAKAAAAGDDALLDDLKAFRDRIVEDANSIDPELPWLNKLDNYTIRVPSDEMVALRGGDGARSWKDFKRAYGPEEQGFERTELFGQKLLMPSAAGGRDVDRQIDDILRANNAEGWFETDLFKSMPAYLRRTSRRYKEEWLAKQLRDLGIAQPALMMRLTEAGVRQGRIKAAVFKMAVRAKVRAELAGRAAAAAEDDVASVGEGLVRGRRLQERAQQGAQQARDEARSLTDMAAVLDPQSLRDEQAEIMVKHAEIGAQRQQLLDTLSPMEDDVFRLGHIEVETSHRLNLETYNASRNVTQLEEKVSSLYTELGDLHERVRLLEGQTDYRKARTKLDEMIQGLHGELDKVANNPGRYAPDKLDRLVAEEARLTALTQDNVAFKAWADKQNNLTRGQSRDFMAGEAAKELQQVEDEIVAKMGEIEEAETALHEFSAIASQPTEPLDAQLAQINEQLPPLVELYAVTDSGTQQGVLKRKIETLSNLQSSILHEKGVIERARGRVADLDRSTPNLVAALDDLKDQEALGNKLIHTMYPDLPAEVQGSRVMDYFRDRMGDLQEQIADTQNAITSAYVDRDSLRVDLSGIREEKRAAERALQKARQKGTEKDIRLAESQAELLAKADALSTRANEIEDEIADVKDHVDTFGPEALGAVGDADTFAERLAEQNVAALEAKAVRTVAAQEAAEANASTARRVADFWENKLTQEWSQPQEEALAWALDDAMTQLGAVSQTQHEWLVDMLKAKTVMNGPQGIRPAIHMYDKVLNLWKAYALATPGTVSRNLFGAVFNNWLSDEGVQFADYRLVQRWGILDRSGRKAATGTFTDEERKIMQAIEGAGLLDGSATSLEIEKGLGTANWNPFSMNGRPIRAIRRGQEGVESLARGALAARVLRNGGTIDEAIARTVKYHFNYDDLNALERSVFRRIVPFYTWTRKNFPLMLEQMYLRPQKFVRFYQARNEIQAQSPEEAIVPGYFAENMSVRMPFSIGGSQAYWLPDLPFTAISDVTDLSQSLSMAAPFVKLPVEYAFGRQFFKGMPLRDEYQEVPSVLKVVPGLMPILGAAGRAQRGGNGEWFMKHKDLYAMESLLPVFGRGRRLFPSEEQYDQRVLSSWLSVMFGTGLRVNSPQEQRNAAYERVDRELERWDSYSELGRLPEDQKMPRPGQTINAAYQYLGVEK